MQVNMTRSPHACWKCGQKLWRIDPPIHGWRYYCGECQHLTSPQQELEEALRLRPEGSVGIVSAVPCRIEVAECPPDVSPDPTPP